MKLPQFILTKFLAYKIARNAILIGLAALTFFSSILLNPNIPTQLASNLPVDITESASASFAGDKLSNFIAQHSGEKLDDGNGNYVGECVSLVKYFLKNYLGIQSGAWEFDTKFGYPKAAFLAFRDANSNNAVPHSGNVNGVPYITTLVSSPSQLQRGDIVFFNETSCGNNCNWSHTGIATGVLNSGTFQMFNQNWSYRSSEIGDFSNSNFYGALRITFANENQSSFGNLKSDFDGDGKADIIWYNSQTGNVNIWYSGNINTGGLLQGGILPSSGWELKGSGDINGDKKSDLIWHNPGSGRVHVWYSGITGNDVLATGVFGNAGWSIKVPD